MRIALMLLLPGLLFGCRGTAHEKAARTAWSGPRPWYLASSERCEFDSSVVHRDPVALLTEFLDRDAHAQFLQSDPWFDGAVDCPGHEPGPDAFEVVTAYRVVFDTLPGDTVRGKITYQVLGSIGGGRVFTPDSGSEELTRKLSNGPFGWRIVGPALDQHVLLDVTLGLPWLTDTLRRQLRGGRRRRGA